MTDAPVFNNPFRKTTEDGNAEKRPPLDQPTKIGDEPVLPIVIYPGNEEPEDNKPVDDPQKIEVTIPEAQDEFGKRMEEEFQHAKEEMEYQKILREHGGLESNIPINHHYWKIRP